MVYPLHNVVIGSLSMKKVVRLSKKTKVLHILRQRVSSSLYPRRSGSRLMTGLDFTGKIGRGIRYSEGASYSEAI